jgi:hypothetical protein
MPGLVLPKQGGITESTLGSLRDRRRRSDDYDRHKVPLAQLLIFVACASEEGPDAW